MGWKWGDNEGAAGGKGGDINKTGMLADGVELILWGKN